MRLGCGAHRGPREEGLSKRLDYGRGFTEPAVMRCLDKGCFFVLTDKGLLACRRAGPRLAG